MTPEVETYLREDPVRNAYACHDLAEEPERSEFWLGRQGGQPAAHPLIYDTSELGAFWAYLAGAPEVAASLVPRLPQHKVVVLAPPELTRIVVQHLPGARVILEDTMGVARGEGMLGPALGVVRLGPERAEAYARLVVPPVVPRTGALVERVRRHLAQDVVYGVLQEGVLVAVAGCSVRTPWTWVVGGVETHPDHRRRGFARAVTSAVTREGLAATGRVGLWVASENEAAKTLYRGLGFRKLGESAWIDMETGVTT